VAITALASRLDLAAVEVEGREAAVIAPQTSYVAFSLCRVRILRTRVTCTTSTRHETNPL